MKLLAALSLGLLVACSGGGGDSSGSTTPPANVAGSWSGFWKSSNHAPQQGDLDATLTQSGSSATGDATMVSACGSDFTMSVSFNGERFTGHLLSPSETIFIQGDAYPASAPTQIKGSYSVQSGGCQGDVGTFAMTPGSPLTSGSADIPIATIAVFDRERPADFLLVNVLKQRRR